MLLCRTLIPPCLLAPATGPRACRVGDPAGLSPGAPHRVGGLPVSKPGLDADTQCQAGLYRSPPDPSTSRGESDTTQRAEAVRSGGGHARHAALGTQADGAREVVGRLLDAPGAAGGEPPLRHGAVHDGQAGNLALRPPQHVRADVHRQGAVGEFAGRVLGREPAEAGAVRADRSAFRGWCTSGVLPEVFSILKQVPHCLPPIRPVINES